MKNYILLIFESLFELTETANRLASSGVALTEEYIAEQKQLQEKRNEVWEKAGLTALKTSFGWTHVRYKLVTMSPREEGYAAIFQISEFR